MSDNVGETLSGLMNDRYLRASTAAVVNRSAASAANAPDTIAHATSSRCGKGSFFSPQLRNFIFYPLLCTAGATQAAVTSRSGPTRFTIMKIVGHRSSFVASAGRNVMYVADIVV